MKYRLIYLRTIRLLPAFLPACIWRMSVLLLLAMFHLTLPGRSLAESTGEKMPQAEVLNKLRTINRQLTGRVAEYGSPEGEFLEALRDHRPFSPEVIDQLITMVDIRFRSGGTTEKINLTTHSPCAGALLCARAQSLPAIEEALQRPTLPPALRPFLVELKKRVELGLAGDRRAEERKKQREALKTQPGAQHEQRQVPPIEQWLFSADTREPHTETKKNAPSPAPEAGSKSHAWTKVDIGIVVASIVAGIAVLWLLLKRR